VLSPQACLVAVVHDAHCAEARAAHVVLSLHALFAAACALATPSQAVAERSGAEALGLVGAAALATREIATRAAEGSRTGAALSRAVDALAAVHATSHDAALARGALAALCRRGATTAQRVTSSGGRGRARCTGLIGRHRETPGRVRTFDALAEAAIRRHTPAARQWVGALTATGRLQGAVTAVQLGSDARGSLGIARVSRSAVVVAPGIPLIRRTPRTSRARSFAVAELRAAALASAGRHARAARKGFRVFAGLGRCGSA